MFTLYETDSIQVSFVFTVIMKDFTLLKFSAKQNRLCIIMKFV